MGDKNATVKKSIFALNNSKKLRINILLIVAHSMENSLHRILVRTPNWLGDAVMSSGFFHAAASCLSGTAIDALTPAPLQSLFNLMPSVSRCIPFNRPELRNPAGLLKFIRGIRNSGRYDAYFCLPDSFSSALTGFLTRTPKRIGYQGQCRSPLFTHSLSKPTNRHRVEEYTMLLRVLDCENAVEPRVFLDTSRLENKNLPSHLLDDAPLIIYNGNSEARSRRIPEEKSRDVVSMLLTAFPSARIVLTGTLADTAYNQRIQSEKNLARISDFSGKTSLPALCALVCRATVVVSTDSGLAHLANAMDVPTVVVFGAGDDVNTAPYNASHRKIIRAMSTACSRCVSNTCRYGRPRCLEELDPGCISQAIHELCPSLSP